jgi:hypothetical protein
MPRGPKGKRRPADVIGNAVKVMRIATGEEPEDYGVSPESEGKDPAAVALGLAGRAGRLGRLDCRRASGKRSPARYRSRLAIFRRTRAAGVREAIEARDATARR